MSKWNNAWEFSRGNGAEEEGWGAGEGRESLQSTVQVWPWEGEAKWEERRPSRKLPLQHSSKKGLFRPMGSLSLSLYPSSSLSLNLHVEFQIVSDFRERALLLLKPLWSTNHPVSWVITKGINTPIYHKPHSWILTGTHRRLTEPLTSIEWL